MGKTVESKDCERALRKVLAEFREEGCMMPKGIFEGLGSGFCEDFAMRVIKEMGGYSETLYELSTENFTDDIFINPGRLGKYGSLPENVNPKTFDPPAHVWIYCDGLQYDEGTPQGVDNFFDLGIFRRFIALHQTGSQKLNP